MLIRTHLWPLFVSPSVSSSPGEFLLLRPSQMGNKGAVIRVCADMVPHFTRFCAIPHQPVCPMQFRHMLFICLHGAVQRIIILTGMMLRDSYCFPDKTCLSPRHMFLRLRITFAPEPEVAKPLLQENGWTCTNLLMSIRCKGSTMSNNITMSTDFNCDGLRGVRM